MPKFPEVEVQLSGEDGNPFFIIGRTMRALQAAGHHEAASEYQKEATSGDFDNVLQTTMRYVETV